MARRAPERTDTLHALADEVLQNYGHGRVVVAIDGPDAEITASFADDLAVALRGDNHGDGRGDNRGNGRGTGRVAERGSITPGEDADTVRSRLIAPFRLPGQEDAFLVLDGRDLLSPALKGLWNFSVRLDSRIASTDRADASAIVNVDDPEHPRRVFADSC